MQLPAIFKLPELPATTFSNLLLRAKADLAKHGRRHVEHKSEVAQWQYTYVNLRDTLYDSIYFNLIRKIMETLGVTGDPLYPRLALYQEGDYVTEHVDSFQNHYAVSVQLSGNHNLLRVLESTVSCPRGHYAVFDPQVWHRVEKVPEKEERLVLLFWASKE